MARTKQPVIDGKKFCIHCGETKSVSEFYKIRQRGFEYYDSRCNPCRKKYHAKYARKWHVEHPHISKEYSRKWRKENRERSDFLMWRSHVKRKYGLTDEEAHAILSNPQCAICGDKHFNGRKPLVDHCHNTQKVRGLLCINCNRAIERIEKIPDWCERALCYLGKQLAPDSVS